MPASSCTTPCLAALLQKEDRSPRARASEGELFLERRVSELGIEVEDLRPVRHDRLGEVALTVEHLLEKRILRGIAVEHDVGRPDEFREELLRRVHDLNIVLLTQFAHRLGIPVDVEGIRLYHRRERRASGNLLHVSRLLAPPGLVEDDLAYIGLFMEPLEIVLLPDGIQTKIAVRRPDRSTRPHRWCHAARPARSHRRAT